MGHGFLRTQQDYPNGTKELAMSPMKRYANKQAKARKRRRLKAQERLKQQRAQAQHSIEAIHQALKDLDVPETLVAEIAGRLQANRSCWAKSSASCFPRSLDADMAMSSRACADGTRMSRPGCWALCPNAPG